MEEFYQYAIKTAIKNISLKRKLQDEIKKIPFYCELDDKRKLTFLINSEDEYGSKTYEYDLIFEKIKKMTFDEISKDVKKNKLDASISFYDDEYSEIFDRISENMSDYNNYKFTVKSNYTNRTNLFDVKIEPKSLDALFAF
jgi:hypothetical protein